MTEKTNKQIAIDLKLKERVGKLGKHREVSEKMGLSLEYFRKMIYGEAKATAPFLEKLEKLEELSE